MGARGDVYIIAVRVRGKFLKCFIPGFLQGRAVAFAVRKSSTAEEEAVGRFRRGLWRSVAKIVVENKWIINEAKTQREAYYLVRNMLAKVDEKLYHEFSSEEAYYYFTQDFLNRLEAWGAIERKPPADPVGSVIVNGRLEQIQSAIASLIKPEDYRGIIYVEKFGAAERLRPLSELGFIIMAGKGFPTRLIREFAKRGKLFVYHDCDKAGNDIYRVFTEGAKRLKRISEDYAARWIVSHAKDVGLFLEDAVKLGLDPEPEPRRRRGRRYELEALYAKLRMLGIEEPHVAYVSYQLEKRYGIELRPMVLDPVEMYISKASTLISLSIALELDAVVKAKASEVLSSVQQAGQLLLDGYRLREDLLRRIVEESVQELARRLASGIAIEIRSDDLTVIIGGVTGFSNEREFEQKFKERYGVNKLYDLLG